MRGTKFAFFFLALNQEVVAVPVARCGGSLLRICCGLPTPLRSGSRCWISAHFILQSSRCMLRIASIFFDLSMIFWCRGHLGLGFWSRIILDVATVPYVFLGISGFICSLRKAAIAAWKHLRRESAGDGGVVCFCGKVVKVAQHHSGFKIVAIVYRSIACKERQWNLQLIQYPAAVSLKTVLLKCRVSVRSRQDVEAWRHVKTVEFWLVAFSAKFWVLKAGKCHHLEVKSYALFVKGSWEAILPCYGQIEFWDLKWWRVVRDWDLTLMKGGVRLYTT